jgi:ABC-type sugar transport system ATPase subunit
MRCSPSSSNGATVDALAPRALTKMEISIERLRFERDRMCVLDIPALTFASGTITALFGPNGSGKTTLLRLIAKLERPTAGRVHLGAGPRPDDRSSGRRVAYAFQEAVFLRGSVRKNLDLALDLRSVPPAERDARITEVAAECGITPLMDRPARALSAGEAQRVNLARALALRAPVTLLDEPLAGLDRITRAQLLDDLPRWLARFAATVIIVTHDREEAFRIADHLVVLVAGQVRAAGPKGEIYRNPGDRATAELLGYTVIPMNGDLRGMPPGALRPGTGPDALEIVVERVVDMGNHQHALGSVNGVRVDIRLAPGAVAPAAGTRMSVIADRSVRLGG